MVYFKEITVFTTGPKELTNLRYKYDKGNRLFP